MLRTTLTIFIAAIMSVSVADCAELIGMVVAITDGDTITLLDSSKQQHRVRLQGIDAPEERQAFGTRAKEALGRKLHEKQIRIEWTKRDTYDRILGEVFVDDRWINKEMVADGWAWHFKKYSTDPDLASAETEARGHKVGLWAASAPLPPWDFRHSFELADKALDVQPAALADDVTVYVTKTGAKYHRASCRHLTDTSRPLTLSEAKTRADACKACKPPH